MSNGAANGTKIFQNGAVMNLFHNNTIEIVVTQEIAIIQMAVGSTHRYTEI